MRILFLTHAFNSLSQRLFIELRQLGHEVSVEFDINDAVSEEAVALFQPDLVIAPFLKRAIPESIWRHHVCLVVHPGIPGDRGPAALDWALLEGRREWGVTVLQANAEMDAGDIWAWAGFEVPEGVTKASLYRNQVTEAAVRAVLEAVDNYRQAGFRPRPLNYNDPDIQGCLKPGMKQSDRAIDWHNDETATVLRKIRCADGFPGLLVQVDGRPLYLFDAHQAAGMGGEPGSLLARCGDAICRATRDGAVWIGHLRDRAGEHPFKLPATRVLGELADSLPEAEGYPGIRYEREGAVGYLHFPFYNGAMSTGQCHQLIAAYREAAAQDTRVLVLMGGPDYWSNGLHLNTIEAAESPADESWANINAINDLAREIITTGNQLTVSALRGNAGAGGVFLARTADRVWARRGVVLNPHYKDMGNLYGSEYWTYLLPRRVGEERARQITQGRLPMGVVEAMDLGLVDSAEGVTQDEFLAWLQAEATALAASPEYDTLLQRKRDARAGDEAQKPLEQYRAEELERMRLNFYGFDPSYHVARYNFVYKIPKSRTPVTIARHRDKRLQNTRRRAS